MIATRMATVRGVDFEVLEGGAGPETFFVLHSITGFDRDSRFLAALAARGRVVAPLLPGYGASPDAPGLRTMLDATLLALDLLDTVDGDAIVVGHGIGGMVAAEMAAIAVNDVRRLALVAPLGLWLDDHPVPDVFAMAPAEIAATLSGSPHAAVAALDDPEHLEAVIVRTLRELTTAGKLLFPIPDRGLADRLGRVKARTVLVWGTDDRYVAPAYADAFAAHLPEATAVVIPNGAHLVPEERPDDVADAIVTHLAAALAS